MTILGVLGHILLVLVFFSSMYFTLTVVSTELDAFFLRYHERKALKKYEKTKKEGQENDWFFKQIEEIRNDFE
jgi:hypothetical protein